MNFFKKNIWLLVLISGAAAGVIPAFSRIALESMNSGTLTILRYIYTGIALLALSYITRQKTNWKSIVKVLPVSVLAAINAICFAIAIKYIPASSIQLLYIVVPILVALLSWVFLHQKTSLGKIIGIVVGFVGVLIVTIDPILQGSSVASFNVTGVLIVFLGAASFSLYSVLSKPAQDFATPGDILLGTAVATIVCQALLMLITAQPLTAISNISVSSLLASIVVGLIGTTVFYWVYQYIVKISTPVIASITQYVMPLFGAIWAFSILGDALTFTALIGGVVALLGAAQVTGILRQIKKDH